MRFADIPGHQSVKDQLTAIVDAGRMPHALLLEGKHGIGKFMLARALAQYIHCNNRKDGDSCGVCPSCKQHQSFNQIDTHYVYPVLKKKGDSSNPVSMDYYPQWKEYLANSPYMDFNRWLEALGNENGQPIIYVDESKSLIRNLNLTAHASKYKIVLMWLPERMKEECANKLLKLIEEPYEDTIFIMTSDEPANILPTIYSRLRRVTVKRLPEEQIKGYLSSRLSIDETVASKIAHLSEGSMLEAINRISTTDSDARKFQLFVQLMRLAYTRDIVKLRAWAEEVASLGREKIMDLLSYCECMIGENFICNLNRRQLVYLSAEELEFSKKFARFINERNVLKFRSLFVEARVDIAGNANAKMVMFDIAVKSILLIKL